MGLTGPKSLQIVLCVAILQSALCFVLDVTPRPSENPKGNLRNVSVRHLDSGFLKPLFQDVTRLKISYSKIQKIDRNAFDYLTHLNLLELSNIEMEEEIDPQTFSRLPGLEMLILRNLGLRRINLNLSHVQELNLARNEMEIFDGGWISGKDVDFLDLSGNKLRALTGSFANMTKLSMIDISKNKIVEVSGAFEGNPKLLKILASENSITSTEGLRLPGLKTLDLFRNALATLNSESFSKMASLEELILAFNIIEHLDDPFGDLIELRFLNLAWNKIGELQPDLFRNNLYLTKLSLQGNKIKSLKKFQSVHEHLTHLDLSHNQLDLLDNSFFSSTPNLQVLDLSFNYLKTLNLARLADLKILNLAYNHITMTGYELSRNRQLLRVNLSSNGLEVGLSHFRNNRMLNNLDLSNNDISNFCDADVELKQLLKLDLRKNLIRDLKCLKNFKSLCEVDLRKNPLTCGEELDDLIQNFVQTKGAPYKLVPEFQADLLNNECENLSLNRSFDLWNSVRRELCPKARDLEMETSEESQEWESAEEEEDTSEEFSGPEEAVEEKEKERVVLPKGAHPRKGPYIVQPIGWIGNDEMNKPNPMQNSQSERASWESIERNGELLSGFEDEDPGKRSRFSWYTIALILIGLSLTLTCFNLAVFLYIRLRVWRRANANSQQRYTVLHNEVYKNTTEPGGEKEWPNETQTKNKIFTFGRLDEILLNFALNKKDKDSESARNVLISPANNTQH